MIARLFIKSPLGMSFYRDMEIPEAWPVVRVPMVEEVRAMTAMEAFHITPPAPTHRIIEFKKTGDQMYVYEAK